LRFLDPAFLLGLLAIGIPVALHLLFRRRVPVLDFPLMRLIARAERSRQPRRRLNRVLLLIARALALALLSLALARALVGPGRVVAASGPVAAVFVMDDSLSMRAKTPEGVSAFDHGRASALELLRLLPEGSLAAVLPLSDLTAGESTGLVEPGAARALIEELEAGRAHARLGPAVDAALRLLATAPLTDRRLVLVSDLARHGFEDLAVEAGEGDAPRLELVVPPAPEGVNRSVSGLEATALPDGRLAAIARVSAWGGAAKDVAGELRVGPAGGERRLAGRAELSPGGGAAVERRFEVSVGEAGFAAAEFRLEEDVLPDDDSREAAGHLARRLALLVVDGDPQNLSFGSETFYLERALAPGVGLDFETSFVTVPELRPEDFRDSDVVVLCNVPELSEERTAALTEAVRGGLGVVVALGDRVSQPVYNGRLAELLPALVGPPVALELGAEVQPLEWGQELKRVGVRGFFSLEPDAGATVSGRLAGGEPLVVESELGAGRVVLLATTLDRDWTDLPISPQFLPFLHALVERVSSRQRAELVAPVAVGAVADLSGAAGGVDDWIILPDGTRRPLPADARFTETLTPGVHLLESEGVVVAAFPVVTDPAESDLSRQSRADVAGALQDALVVDALTAGESTGGGGRPLWGLLLAGLVLVTAAESWLARRAA
jgi:hypothetical protein